MDQSLSVRRTAAALRVCVETAFRWCHRLLAVLAAQPAPRFLDHVQAGLAYFRYSQKGQRNTSPPMGRFGPVLFPKPVAVLLLYGRPGRVAAIVGRGRPRPDELERCLVPLIGPDTQVWAMQERPLAEACRCLAIRVHEVLPECWWYLGDLVRYRHALYTWMRAFHGVATRYLHHYLAWFTHLPVTD